jgi:hypothetical protein
VVIQNKSGLSCFRFLVEACRPVLQCIHACDTSYELGELFLSRCEPERQRRLSLANVRAFFSSVIFQRMLGIARPGYWKFVLTAATR